MTETEFAAAWDKQAAELSEQLGFEVYADALFYEGNDPEGFAREIKAEFGFDLSADPTWGEWVEWGDWRPPAETELGFWSYAFHPPIEHYDALHFSGGRWPIGC